MANRNPQLRYNCPRCGRIIREKDGKLTNHGIGQLKGRAERKHAKTPCEGSGAEVREM